MTTAITVEGNLTAAPTLRYSESGTPWATFTVAVNHVNPETREQTRPTDFWDVVAWYNVAEHAAESLKKGDTVIVTGRLGTNPREVNGRKFTNVRIEARGIGLSLRYHSASSDRHAEQASKAKAGSIAPLPPAEDDGDMPF